MTLDEAIEYEKKISSTNHLQIADWLKMLKDIQSTGSCNTCKSKRMCEYEPEAGQMTRYNCPFYKEEKIIEYGMIYGRIYDEFCKKFPNTEVSDFRPALPMYIPGLSNLTKGIPNAIVVWLKDGTKVVYMSEEAKDE